MDVKLFFEFIKKNLSVWPIVALGIKQRRVQLMRYKVERVLSARSRIPGFSNISDRGLVVTNSNSGLLLKASNGKIL
ncbi:hypothetical protein A2125_01625 [Candidatus Woesebacteria bacterium GWB1_43_5]|uniref:Uncharacterized protein n=1 Tax=Candidatus Woesebacteria bacterium GWB1_43_5 TaxID=1802474 RepID=A0A1F7WVA7_9BACT|nr:MAG: hypothetical protein A2125_01625 [Candidatus Woesebacteria bacterium GWB1_43_5]